jgi:hypothetical protein
MADLCDFVRELGTENSHWRKRWKKDPTPSAREQVAKDFGLSQNDVVTVRKVLDSGDTTPIRKACGQPIEALWIK